MSFALPISLNILVIYASIRHVCLTFQLHRAQHRLSARDKYHRSLVMQFVVFYAVWLLFWSPNVIACQLKTGNNNITMIVQLLSFIEITLDPFIIGALDARFRQIWYQIWRYWKREPSKRSNRNRAQVGPNTIVAALPVPNHMRDTAV